ncbi:NADPH:quinone oxidoreductase family protein [Actinomadura geliboluensis]|uniref:NADPH:quinone oxidoreductase family protein n=1 Tax=Actinomadura geliboluensis TaxID=882440 RepID=A0A5S4H790_9ACTN|nr:NADPH:quinone oxidoreductase family protein [Actinomadura geliboluensis]TMR40624.1 NADPH:quinone oxidoreductase family protein [Actinomadura geliboluensis]
MRAIRVEATNGPEAALPAEVPAPAPGDHVLVDVHAAGVSFPELLMCSGQYQMRPDPPFVPGSEVAGTVVSAPPGSGLGAGDRVAAFSVYGGWAERVAVPVHAVFALPPGLSFTAGAALPMNYLTGHFALVRRARLEKGETVLVHGAAGGVGTAAIQIARTYGARVIAVASSAAKRDLARQAGADHTVDVPGFAAAVRDLTRGTGADVIVDPVGGDRVTDSLRCLRPEERLLVVGFTGGEIPSVRLNRLLLNNISVVGVAWGAYWMSRPAYLAEQLPIRHHGSGARRLAFLE